MAIFTGKDGSITFAGDVQTRVKNWTLEGSLAVLDTTELGNDAVQNEAGLKSYSGSATIMYHNENNRLSNMLNNLFTTGVPAKATVRFDWGAKGVSFNAFVTSASLAMTTGEIMTADVTFTSAGDVIFTNL